MKMRRNLLAAVSSLAVMSAVLLTGCGAPADEGTAIRDTGFLTLSVNPEIRIEYDEEGRVIGLTGQNDDGKNIVASYPDYIGKECDEVLNDLIVKINEAGYFVEEIEGGRKNIVLQLEPGSVVPSSTFLEDVTASTQNAVKNLNLSSGIVTIDDDDYDPAYAKTVLLLPTSLWKRRKKLPSPMQVSMRQTPFLTTGNLTMTTEPLFLNWNSPQTAWNMNTT